MSPTVSMGSDFDDWLRGALLGLGPHPGQPEAMKFCPAHPNTDTPALSTNLRKGENKTLFKCWTGCSQEEVLGALLGPSDKRQPYTSGRARQATVLPRPVSETVQTEYQCTDPDGRMWTHVRLDYADRPKRMWWDPAGSGAHRRFYIPAGSNLAEFDHLWLTEGEPAAEALWAAGEPAVGLCGGVSSPPDEETLAHILAVAPNLIEVLIWPDAHDPHGQEWTATVAGHLRGRVETVLVVSPPDDWQEGWDAADILWPNRTSPMLHGFVPSEEQGYEVLERLGKHVYDPGLLKPWDGIDGSAVDGIINDLIDVRYATYSPDADECVVEGFIRPRTVDGLAAFEGTGKSHARTELGLRVAMGEGSWLGVYGIPKARRVLVVDMENGPDEEMRREDLVLAGMGKTRHDIPDGMYMRVSFPAISLDSEEGRRVLRGLVAHSGPDLLALDSGTMLVDDEVGARLKPVIRFLKRLAWDLNVAILVVLHMVKPMRDPKRQGAAQSRRLADVAGNWTKGLDVVAVLSEQDREDELRIDIRKRIDPSSYVIRQQDGLWVAVKAIRESVSATMPKVQWAILTDVHAGRALTRRGLIELHNDETGFSKANAHKGVTALIEMGYLTEDPSPDGEKVLHITEAGDERLSSARAEDRVPLDEA